MQHTIGSIQDAAVLMVEMKIAGTTTRTEGNVDIKSYDAGKQASKISQVHADLFVIRHLLILREQLLPFEMRLQTVEKQLDFTPTTSAFTRLLESVSLNIGSRINPVNMPSNSLHLSTSNALLSAARESLPAMKEKNIDTRRHLDTILKNTCTALKRNCMTMLQEPLEIFLAKCVAFVGEISLPEVTAEVAVDDVEGAHHVNTPTPLLSEEAVKSLLVQSFVRPERLRELAKDCNASIVRGLPQFLDLMKMYIQNQVARTILLRPIFEEALNNMKRVQLVVTSCYGVTSSITDSKEKELLEEYYQYMETIKTMILSQKPE